MSVNAAMPEIRTLARNQSAALGRLAPLNCDSGTLRGKRTIKGGRPVVRKSLFTIVLTAVQHHPDFKRTFQEMPAKGKIKKVALYRDHEKARDPSQLAGAQVNRHTIAACIDMTFKRQLLSLSVAPDACLGQAEWS